MAVTVHPFTLEGCRCRIKFDPKELQAVLHEELNKKAQKKEDKLGSPGDNIDFKGAFLRIDEGNFALHFMLAFLGKASMECRVLVSQNGKPILDETITMAATCAAFSPPKSQLKTDAKMIADKIVKLTLKRVKEINS